MTQPQQKPGLSKIIYFEQKDEMFAFKVSSANAGKMVGRVLNELHMYGMVPYNPDGINVQYLEIGSVAAGQRIILEEGRRKSNGVIIPAVKPDCPYDYSCKQPYNFGSVGDKVQEQPAESPVVYICDDKPVPCGFSSTSQAMQGIPTPFGNVPRVVKFEKPDDAFSNDLFHTLGTAYNPLNLKSEPMAPVAPAAPMAAQDEYNTRNSGSDPPIIHIGDAPAEDTPINAITGKNDTNSDECMIVMFYHPRCKHSHNMIPTWNDFEKYKHKSLKIVKVDISNESPSYSRMKGIQGIPTIRFYKNKEEFDNGCGVDYDGDRTPKSLYDFMIKMLMSNNKIIENSSGKTESAPMTAQDEYNTRNSDSDSPIIHIGDAPAEDTSYKCL